MLYGWSGTPHLWSRDALRAAAHLPEPVEHALARMTWDGLVALAVRHLLGAETRPDERLIWRGDPADPWPFGAWIVGATVILGGPEAPGADDPGARVYAAAPDWPPVRPPV